MNSPETWVVTAAFGLVGMVVGWLYLQLLRMSLTHLQRPRGVWMFLGFLVLRVALFGGILVLALFSGTWALVAYAIGFIVARTVILARARAGTRDAVTDPEDKGRDDG